MVAVGAVEAEFVGQLGKEVNVARDVGKGCAAAVAYPELLSVEKERRGKEKLTREGVHSAACTQTHGTNYAAADPC